MTFTVEKQFGTRVPVLDPLGLFFQDSRNVTKKQNKNKNNKLKIKNNYMPLSTYTIKPV